jgi:hypothetical protein
MAKLVDVLAMLVRKNFGHHIIGKSRDLSLLGLTFEQAYETVEARAHEADEGDFGSEGGEKGEVIVFRVNADGSKPSAWLVERTLPDGEPY